MSQRSAGILNGRKNTNKMRNNTLFELLQNTVVGAIALHGFTLGYHYVAKNKDQANKFPKLGYCFYVLPIVYNQDAMDTFRSSNELYTVLIKNSSIVLGLQERANKMSIQTFDSLCLAFSKKILTINKAKGTIELGKGFQVNKLPLPLSMKDDGNSVKKIQNCSFKLGSIFAKRNEHNIRFELNITL
jgi:hypothetical protein